MDWTRRSLEKEEMDIKQFSFQEYRQCLSEISQISRFTGQTKPIENFVKRLYSQGGYSATRPLKILEVGYGAGDLLAQLGRQTMHLRLTGIDLHPWAEKVARSRHRQQAHITYQTADLREYQPEEPVDVVIGSLMLHHLTDDEIVCFFSWMMRVARKGWVVGDLARSRVAFYGAKLLSSVLSTCETVKNDAPLSVQRAFHLEDLQRLVSLVRRDEWRIQIGRHFPYKVSVSALKRVAHEH